MRASRFAQPITILTIENKTDSFYKPIVTAFITLGGYARPLKFKDIYEQVCLNLGSKPSDAKHGIAPCPITGRVMNHKGRIRSWIEERSPCSRQHYFRAGKVAVWKPNKCPLLFINNKLGRMNQECNWQPYNRVTGDGWLFNPPAANQYPLPSYETIIAAAAMYRRKGMQGMNRVQYALSVVNTTTIVNPTSMQFKTYNSP